MDTLPHLPEQPGKASVGVAMEANEGGKNRRWNSNRKWNMAAFLLLVFLSSRSCLAMTKWSKGRYVCETQGRQNRAEGDPSTGVDRLISVLHLHKVVAVCPTT